MLLTCAVLLASDALAYLYRGGTGTVAYYMVRISNFIVFFASDVILFLFHGYVCNRLFLGRAEKRPRTTEFCVAAVYVLAVAGALLVVVSQFTGLYYRIGSDNLYQRSDCFFISLLLPAIGMLVDFFLTVRYRKNVNREIFVSLVLYFVLPFAAEIVQTFWYGPSFINISLCVSVIIMFATSLLDQSRQLTLIERETVDLKDSLRTAIGDRESCYAAVAQIYLSMHLIDVKTGSYQSIKSAYYIENHKGSEDGGLFPDQIVPVMDQIVTEQYKKSVFNFTDLSSLNDRLNEKNVIEHVFLSNTLGWCRESFIKVDCDEENRLRHVLFCIEIIDDAKRRENHLQYLAETDLMTDLTNRGTGEKRVKDLLSRQVEGLFCLIDCDKFKTINDVYGHSVGDQVIVAFAACLKASCRDNDVVFRLGGDEFAVYSTAIQNREQADEFIDNLFDNVRAIRVPGAENSAVSISVGAVFFRGGDASFDRLYRQADFAMYESKKVKGCKATFYQDE